MPTTQDPQADVFVTLLTQQRDLYAQVQAIGQRQAALIERGDTQGLLVVLQERQSLIESLGELNRRILPHREAWSRQVEHQPTSRRETVKQLLDEIQGLLGGILQQDEQDRESLQGRMGQVRQALNRLGQGAQAARAYGQMAPPPAAARFTDRRG